MTGAFQTASVSGVVVQATSSESFLTVAFAGGVGFYAGIAGAISVSLIDSDTSASIGTNAKINRRSGAFNPSNPSNVAAAQGVYVNASNIASLQGINVGVGVGIVGLAGAIGVGTIRNSTSAVIGSGAKITARHDVEVNALSQKSLEGIAVAGGGGVVGLAGSVNVYSIGEAFNDSYSDEEGGSQKAASNPGDANDTAAADADTNYEGAADNSDDALDGLIGNANDDGNVNTTTPDERALAGLMGGKLGAKGDTDTKALLEAAEDLAEPGIAAVVNGGTTEILTLGGVNVHADERVTVNMITGTAAVGLGAVGASIAIVNIESNVRAKLGGTVDAKGAVSVVATGKRTADFLTVGIQGGLVAIGASVSILNDNGKQLAEISNNAKIRDASQVDVLATNVQSADADTFTVGGGAVAAGVNFSRLNLNNKDDAIADNTKTFDTHARIGDNVELGDPMDAAEEVGAVNVKANSTIDATNDTIAVSFGLGAVGINFAFVNITPQVEASVGNTVFVDSAGKLDVEANSSHDGRANIFAITAGAAALGTTFSTSTVEPSVRASIGSSMTANTNGLEVQTTHNKTNYDGTGTTRGAYAQSTAAGGGIVSGQGAIPTASSKAALSSTIGSGGAINGGSGAIIVSARASNLADADAFAVSVGALGIGVSISDADASGSSTAVSNGTITGGASLRIEATTDNNATAFAEASGGGLVSANGHVATATTSPTLVARLNGSTTVDGNVEIEALSVGLANSTTESKAGGFAGVGAGVATATLSPNVTASIESGTVNAGSVLVQARHNFNKAPGQLPGLRQDRGCERGRVRSAAQHHHPPMPMQPWTPSWMAT